MQAIRMLLIEFIEFIGSLSWLFDTGYWILGSGGWSLEICCRPINENSFGVGLWSADFN